MSYCIRCFDIITPGKGGRGLCMKCYNAARCRGGDMPKKGTKPLKKLPRNVQLQPMGEDEDASPFEDATTSPGEDTDLAGVIAVLETVAPSGPFSSDLLRACVKELRRLDE